MCCFVTDPGLRNARHTKLASDLWTVRAQWYYSRPVRLLETLRKYCRTSSWQRIDSCMYSQTYVFFEWYRQWILLWTWIRLRVGRSWCRIPVEGRDSFSSEKCQTGFGASPISYSMGAEYFRGVKRSEREGNLSTTSSAEVENEWSYTSDMSLQRGEGKYQICVR